MSCGGGPAPDCPPGEPGRCDAGAMGYPRGPSHHRPGRLHHPGLFDLTVKAFNLSEKYRTPVIILSDEVVAHTREKIFLPRPGRGSDRPHSPHHAAGMVHPLRRHRRGVPPMGIFGDGYRYHVTGLIHDVHGFPTQRPDEIVPFMNRLFRKINQHFDDIQMVRKGGPKMPKSWWWPTVPWPGRPGARCGRRGRGASRRGCCNS